MDGKMDRNEDIDDIAYHLRCETKRTDLPDEVVENYAEAYLAICILQRHIKDLEEGFEGCCTACEPVGVLNRKLLAENAMLRIYAKNFQSRAMEELARLDEELGLIEPPNKDFLQDLG